MSFKALAPSVLDLSHWNAPRDLASARRAGIRAAIIKCTQGVGGFDKTYTAHLDTVKAANLLAGAYHFGTGQMPGATQARYFVSQMTANGGPLPVLVLDLEANPQGPSMPLIEAEHFIATLAGLAPNSTLMIYGGQYLRELHIPGSSLLARLPLWLADYSTIPKIPAPWRAYTLWQYTDGNHGLEPHTLSDLGPRDYTVAADSDIVNKLWKVAA